MMGQLPDQMPDRARDARQTSAIQADAPKQFALFTPADPLDGTAPAAPAMRSRLGANPHLLTATRIARRMRRYGAHSAAETQAGLAICRQLKAYLADPLDSR